MVTTSQSILAAVFGAAALVFASTTFAQTASTAAAAPAPPPAATAAPSPSEAPRLHHAPVSTARPHESLDIRARIEFPNLLKRALVVYRAGSQVHEVPFMRINGEDYVAQIPAEEVEPPGLAYAIELEQLDGTRIAAFESRAHLQDIAVSDDIGDLRERTLAERLENRRSVFSTSFDYVHFGKTPSSAAPSGLGVSNAIDLNDYYYRTEGAYTYRPLRTVVEFSIRIGVVRGNSPVPGATDPSQQKVGLNYGAPSIVFRLSDAFHLEAQGLTSVTEVGFSGGVGGALHIGDFYGSKLVVGFETVKTFGSRGYARLDIARERFRVSPIIEVTDMPHADRAGVRLVAELAYRLGQGWAFAARGGYQARDFKTGGPGAGVSVSYAF